MQQETIRNRRPREVTLRVGHGTLSFAAYDGDSSQGADADSSAVVYEPFVVKSGISMAANLRDAFRTAPLLQQGYRYARVAVDAPTLLVPMDVFTPESAPELYAYTFPRQAHHVVMDQPLEGLGAIALFGVNKDLKLVVDDHFEDPHFVCALSGLWHRQHWHSYAGLRRRLYAYFHEGCLDVFSFQKNRFKFCNQFEAQHAADALYYLLYIWKQLMLKPEHDELWLLGALAPAGRNALPTQEAINETEQLVRELTRYVGHVNTIPTTDIAAMPAAMPYDLKVLMSESRP